jgi:hypothetical protein
MGDLLFALVKTRQGSPKYFLKDPFAYSSYSNIVQIFF